MPPLLDGKYFFFWGKVFIGMTVFWGTVMGFWLSKQTGKSYAESFTLGYLFGTIFGATITVTLGILDSWYKSKLLQRYGRIDHHVQQKREILLQADYDKALHSCETALNLLGVETLSDGSREGEIRGTVRPTPRSFGERIVVWIEPVSKMQTKVVVESISKVLWTIGDFGKNFENVEEFCLLLQEQIRL